MSFRTEKNLTLDKRKYLQELVANSEVWDRNKINLNEFSDYDIFNG